MDVRIIEFASTPVAVAEHRGPPEGEHVTALRLIAWRQAHRVSPDRHHTYGVHFDDPRTTAPEAYRMDICVSYDLPIEPNPQGIVSKVIPGGRCAVVRYVGSREHVAAAEWLRTEWFPNSGESLRDFPMFFHYVNVGPHVAESEMVTDVYLPLA